MDKLLLKGSFILVLFYHGFCRILGKIFLSILDDLHVDDFFGEGMSHDWQLKICASIACHSAIKAGDILSEEEMQNLLIMLQSANQQIIVHTAGPQL